MFRRLQWAARILHQAGPGSGPRLAWMDSDGSACQCELPADRPVIAGRDPSADIRGYNDRMSRRHFQVAPESVGYMLQDLESRNGTRINGRRLQRRLLRDGDVIEAGRQAFVFLAR